MTQTLSREQIESWRNCFGGHSEMAEFNVLCDMALASLDGAEIIRAAAMEEAAQVAEKNAVKQGVLREKFPPDGKSWTAFDAAEACATDIAASIRALAPTPPGMVCVPREPTKAMCEAADALPAIHAVDDLPLSKAGWSPKAIQNLKRYRAMLAAAPGVKE